MNTQTLKRFASEALNEMWRKITEYEQKPDHSKAWAMRNKEYLKSITEYIEQLEKENHDMQFNAEFLVLTSETNDNTRIKYLEEKVHNQCELLQQAGLSVEDQAYMFDDLKEIRRANSITKAKEVWSELY